MRDGQKTGKIIVYDDKHPPQTPFQQRAENGFPVLEIFATEAGLASKDLLAAIATQAHDDVDTGRAQPIAIAKLNVFAIEKQGQQIAIQGTVIAQFQLFD